MKQHQASAAPFYTEEQSRRWLCWLARTMAEHGQTVFLIEHLQPTWLAARWQRWLYLLATRLQWGLMAGIVFGLISGLASGLFLAVDTGPGASWRSGLGGLLDKGMLIGLSLGLLCGLSGGFFWGLVFGVADIVLWAPTSSRKDLVRDSSTSRFVADFVGVGLTMVVFGSVCGALLGIVVGGAISNPLGGLLVGLTAGLSSGLMYALSFGLIFVLIRTIHSAGRQAGDEVRTTDTVRWNWTGARKSGCRGLMLAFALAGGFGLVFAFIFMLVFGSSGAFIPVLVGGLVIGLVFGLIFGVVVGLAFGLVGSFEQRVEDMKTKPNQGIRLSIRNALFVGGGAGLILGSAVWFLAAPFYGLFYGVFAAFCMALWFGGLDVLKHGTLRTLLYVRGDAPLNYARFLDYAADELNFLQKVGGGYMFVHRYLLEYFADEHAGGEPR